MRHAELFLAARAFIEFAGSRRFHAQIQFQRHRLRQGRHHGCHAQPPCFGGKTFRGTGEEGQRLQIARELFAHLGAQDLDRHPHRRGVAGLGAVHLGDGGGRQGGAEAGKQRLHRLAEGAGDLGPCLNFRKRRQAVLQMLQGARELGAHDIGPRRQHLAQLDIGRSQPLQRAGEPRTGVRLLRTKGPRRPGEQPGGIKKAQGTGDGNHYSRQAECMAAMPPDRLRTFTCSRPASAIMLGEFRLGREAADAFGEIAIGLFVLRHQAADLGHQLEGIGVVQRIQSRHFDLGKFQAEKTPARFQHPPRFRQRLFDMGHIADAEGDGIGVEMAVGERQAFGIAAHPFDGRFVFFFGAAHALAQHLGIDVANRHGCFAATRARQVHDAKGDVAGAARHVQHLPAGLGVQPFHHRILPDAVDAGAHQVVHQVVARRHRREDLSHQAFLLGLGHVAETETGGFLSHDGNIAAPRPIGYRRRPRLFKALSSSSEAVGHQKSHA